MMDLQGGPSIVQLLGVKTTDGIMKLVIPFIEGTKFIPECECQAQNYLKQLCQVFHLITESRHLNMFTPKE